MNQRIAELMVEAGKTIPGDKHIDADFCNEFAELIVEECSDLFEIEWGEEKLTGNDVGYVLKKHFGVE